MSVAACPHCEGEVTLPLGARAASRVKCPLCEAEYSLSEIYEKLPPMLILLDIPVEAHVGAGGMSHGSGAFDSMFAPSGEANGEGELHLAGDDGSFDFGGPSEGGVATATAPTKTLPARAKRPPKSAVKEIVKIVLGGVVGLTIGFFILLWAAGRDLADDVAQKPIGKIMPSWMQWSIPAAHRYPKPAAETVAPDEAEQGDESAGEDADATDGDGETMDDDGMTDTPGDATGTDTTRGDATDSAGTDATGNNSSASETPTDSGSTDTPGTNEQPADPMPETTPPKTPPVDEPGFEITPPKPEFEIEEPKLDPLPGDMPPADAPKVDEPKVDTPPAEGPMAEENPFDVPPGEAPKDDPAVTDPSDVPEVKPETPMAEPMETEPKKPAAGLKVETPVEDAAVQSARSAASGALDTLMPSDAAAKAKFTREKYDSYAKLCEYAQNASHSTPDVSAANAEGAKMMLLMVAADETDNLVLGQLANAWLSKTRGNDGIVLSGKATAVDTAGGLTTVTVELPALGDKLAARTVTIVTRENAEVKAGDSVAAVGSVIEKPTGKIEGYAGADSQVIWGAWVGKRGG